MRKLLWDLALFLRQESMPIDATLLGILFVYIFGLCYGLCLLVAFVLTSFFLSRTRTLRFMANDLRGRSVKDAILVFGWISFSLFLLVGMSTLVGTLSGGQATLLIIMVMHLIVKFLDRLRRNHSCYTNLNAGLLLGFFTPVIFVVASMGSCFFFAASFRIQNEYVAWPIAALSLGLLVLTYLSSRAKGYRQIAKAYCTEGLSTRLVEPIVAWTVPPSLVPRARNQPTKADLESWAADFARKYSFKVAPKKP